jgi:hypothetical protein
MSGTLNNEDVSSTSFNDLGFPKGQLGKIITLNDTIAAKLSYSTNTLYAGLYQFVQFLSSSTAANIRGGAVCWNNRASFIVTPDATAITEGDLAGVGLMINTKGNYGWIQIGGKATVKYRATVTDKTNSNLVIQLTTTNTFDAIADATGSYISGGALGLKNVVGVALETPADAGLKLISLRLNSPNIG